MSFVYNRWNANQPWILNLKLLPRYYAQQCTKRLCLTFSLHYPYGWLRSVFTESQSSEDPEGLPCDTYNVTLDQIGFLKGQDYTLNCSMMSSRSGGPQVVLFQTKNSSSALRVDAYTTIVVQPSRSFPARDFENGSFVNTGLTGNRSAFVTLNGTLPSYLLWKCTHRTPECPYGLEAVKELILIGKPSKSRLWLNGLHLWLPCFYLWIWVIIFFGKICFWWCCMMKLWTILASPYPK